MVQIRCVPPLSGVETITRMKIIVWVSDAKVRYNRETGPNGKREKALEPNQESGWLGEKKGRFQQESGWTQFSLFYQTDRLSQVESWKQIQDWKVSEGHAINVFFAMCYSKRAKNSVCLEREFSKSIIIQKLFIIIRIHTVEISR